MMRIYRVSCFLALLFTISASIQAEAQLISVTAPAYRADVQGDVTIQVSAAGFNSPLAAKSWLPGGKYGSDFVAGSVALNAKGEGSFLFHSGQFAHGPITVRITGTRGADGASDTCYLQLYNTGGIHWKEGVPSNAPPEAERMALVFKDDFDGPLSISATGVGARYGAHKPDGLDFSKIPFANPTIDGPFFQRDSYLIIRGNEKLNTSGLISSVNSKDGTGFTVKAPYYIECRFMAPDAVGSWPAFWTMTDEFHDGNWGAKNDEIDTIEAYGGEGLKNPNSPATYMVTPHMWGYHAGTASDDSNPIDMRKVAGGGGWAYTPHTYGLRVTTTEFIFYLDDVEVKRLPASPLAVKDPTYFMVNLAIGGSGWPVDLSRYDGIVDMYVDYVRVYH